MTTAVVILGLLAAGNAPGGQAAGAGAARALGEAAAQYRSADREDAVAAVAVFTEREIEAGTQGLLEAMSAALAEDGTAEGIAQRQATVVAAAALLADGAVRTLRQGDRRRTRAELRAATRCARALPSSGGHSAFARRLYLVAGLVLHGMGDLAGAYDLLSEARRRWEDDAELLLALGAVCETTAGLRSYDLPGKPRPPPDSRGEPRFAIEGQPDEGGVLPTASAADAQALYARALQKDAGLLEARLRLGRVLLLRGRPREALPELERVGREASEPGQSYMARLFEGRARERLGDLPGAASAFAAALERAPEAQSGLVALGRALDRLGERAHAQEAFLAALRRRGEAPPDPWLDYLRGQPDRVDGLIEELRRLVP